MVGLEPGSAAACSLKLTAPLWERVYHNPVAFLRQVERATLNAVTNDRYYLDLYDRVMRDFDTYMSAEDTWFKRTYPDP